MTLIKFFLSHLYIKYSFISLILDFSIVPFSKLYFFFTFISIISLSVFPKIYLASLWNPTISISIFSISLSIFIRIFVYRLFLILGKSYIYILFTAFRLFAEVIRGYLCYLIPIPKSFPYNFFPMFTLHVFQDMTL